MGAKAVLYRAVVRPGIFQDGTYGVYAIPDSNPAIEYQIDGQFPTAEEAVSMARLYLQSAPGRFASQEVGVEAERKVVLSDAMIAPEEAKQAAVVKAHLKRLMTLPRPTQIRPFSVITEGTPYLLSFLALVVFTFSISLTVPGWVPLLGDWAGGMSFGPAEAAWLFPYVLLAATLYLQVRARIVCLKRAANRDYVLGLALGHGWRRDRFHDLFRDAMEGGSFGWLRKVVELAQNWDPDSLRQVREDAGKSPRRPGEAEDHEAATAAMLRRLYLEDFEARIHGLYYMEKEPDYVPWALALDPVLFLITHHRAVLRGKALVGAGGLSEYLSLGTVSLPGGDYDRGLFKVWLALCAWPVLMLGTPLVWSFALQSWPTALGWVWVALLGAAALVPLLRWNYKLLARRRGLPRGMQLPEIQGDMRFIQGL